MVSARPVNVSVREFFFGRITNVRDFYVEAQRQAGKRVVGVDRDLFIGNSNDGDDLRTCRTLSLELHSDDDVRLLRKAGTGNGLNHFFVALSVSVGGVDADLETVADSLALEFGFETGNDVAGTMEVDERLSALRSVEDLSVVIGQLVLERCHGILGDLHGETVSKAGTIRVGALRNCSRSGRKQRIECRDREDSARVSQEIHGLPAHAE